MPKRRSKHAQQPRPGRVHPTAILQPDPLVKKPVLPERKKLPKLVFPAKYRIWVTYGLAALVSLLFCLPLYWAFIASLRPIGLPPATTVEWWPTAPAWENYRKIFEVVPLVRYTLNSLIVVCIAVPITLLMASLAGFGLSQIDRESTRNMLIHFNVIALMIPASAVWIFRFQILRWLGQLDSLGALILPAFAASSPLFVLLFYWSFRHIPEEMFEAARMDGAAPWTLWQQMAMPLARPTTTGVVVLAFLLYWSDFISPVLYIYDPQKYTLAIGVQIIKQMNITNIPLLMAAATFMAAPIIILFLFLQRFFLHELSLANLFERN
jgi:multiple sugar transport system permease protein